MSHYRDLNSERTWLFRNLFYIIILGFIISLTAHLPEYRYIFYQIFFLLCIFNRYMHLTNINILHIHTTLMYEFKFTLHHKYLCHRCWIKNIDSHHFFYQYIIRIKIRIHNVPLPEPRALFCRSTVFFEMQSSLTVNTHLSILTYWDW